MEKRALLRKLEAQSVKGEVGVAGQRFAAIERFGNRRRGREKQRPEGKIIADRACGIVDERVVRHTPSVGFPIIGIDQSRSRIGRDGKKPRQRIRRAGNFHGRIDEKEKTGAGFFKKRSRPGDAPRRSVRRERPGVGRLPGIRRRQEPVTPEAIQ